MKLTLTLIVLALALFAPGLLLAQTQTPATENPAHQELRQLRDGLLTAMNKGDLDGLLPFLHTNCVITWHNAEVSRGREGVRAYFSRVMTGPDKLVESFHCDLKVDELTSLYGDNMGICFGSSDEHFKLTSGKDLNVKGRWSATLMKENGHWLVASLHASTNLFDNVMLNLAKKTAIAAAIACLFAGVVIGWLRGVAGNGRPECPMLFRQDQAAESEASLLRRAENWPEHPRLESLTAETLQTITRAEGVDFATALLFQRYQKDPKHGVFIRRINSLRLNTSAGRSGIEPKVVIIPGALYVERPDIGGDGRLVREIAGNFGWSSDLMPLASVGSVVENAQSILDWMRQHSAEKTILVSLSKGGAELKIALTAPEAPVLFRNVLAWINVCGPLNGSHMADWILASPLRTGLFRLQYRLQRRDFRFITDLRHAANSPLDFPLTLPPGVKLVNLVGFPLRRHLTTPFSRFYHRTLAAYGPNDGTISLSDLRDWPGDVYPAWGMDHFFRPEDEARHLVVSVFQYLAKELNPVGLRG